MVKIEFTCYVCGNSSEISADDIEEKTIVPVCDDCYSKFLTRKKRLIRSCMKRLTGIYVDYGIPIDTFNASEELAELKE